MKKGRCGHHSTMYNKPKPLKTQSQPTKRKPFQPQIRAGRLYFIVSTKESVVIIFNNDSLLFSLFFCSVWSLRIYRCAFRFYESEVTQVHPTGLVNGELDFFCSTICCTFKKPKTVLPVPISNIYIIQHNRIKIQPQIMKYSPFGNGQIQAALIYLGSAERSDYPSGLKISRQPILNDAQKNAYPRIHAQHLQCGFG